MADVNSSAQNTTQDGAAQDNEVLVCWYCAETPATERKVYAKLDLYKETKYVETENDGSGKPVDKFEIVTVKFPVPRCLRCDSIHSRRVLLSSMAVLGTLVINGLLLAAYIDRTGRLPDTTEAAEWVGVGLVIYSVLGLISVGMRKALAGNIPDERHKVNYPVVRKLTSEGWRIGVKSNSGGSQAVRKAA